MRVQTRAPKSRELADRVNVDGTTSSGNVDSLRVIAALQAKKKNRKLTCVVRATSPTRTVSVRAR